MPSSTLRSLDEFGPFFTVDEFDHVPSSVARPDAWRRLVDDLRDDAAMTAVVARAAQRQACAYGVATTDVETRAIGSVVHLGWCARLVSPWIGHSLLTSHPWVPRPDELWWCDDGTTTFPLAVECGVTGSDPAPADGPTNARAATSFASDVAALLEPLAASALCRSPRIAWGNAASAINGAAMTVAHRRPDLSAAATRLAEACIAALPGEDASSGTAATLTFRRRSCCQLYRLPGLSRASVCGDCVLIPTAERERTRLMPG